jgi:hypothetical protein
MAQFAIEIADADVDRVMNAVSANYGYQENIANPDYDNNVETSESNPETITNPESKPVFVNKVVRNFLQEHVTAYEVAAAKAAAASAANTNVVINDPQLP